MVAAGVCLGIVIIRTTRACLATTRALVGKDLWGLPPVAQHFLAHSIAINRLRRMQNNGDYQKNGSEDMEKVEPPCATDGNVQVQLLWETARQVLKVTLRITV